MPALKHLVGAYLTLDWPEEYGDPWRAVEDFVRGAPDEAAALGDEVAKLLATNPTEAALRRLISEELFSGYAPEADGWTYRAWLEAVVQRINEIQAS